ncbi:MAG TPA: hypothetical protein PKH07_04895, partial [bacterium]|nr:hypothetical protein [bacterium]
MNTCGRVGYLNLLPGGNTSPNSKRRMSLTAYAREDLTFSLAAPLLFEVPRGLSEASRFLAADI